MERIDPPEVGGERAMLRACLDFRRATLAVKCEGLPWSAGTDSVAVRTDDSQLPLVRMEGYVRCGNQHEHLVQC
ncbi:hypothetical protein AB0L13_35905 [Saccharopolyspora shandongensis]|uniref:hypothetical protein n=1 Tax=Saccharopolyspora shandongensis TaxID=418495 RepID=UPI00343B5ACC